MPPLQLNITCGCPICPHHVTALDAGKPLIALANGYGTMSDVEVKALISSAFSLWGNEFHDITSRRRKAILRHTNPNFLGLLSDQSAFLIKESDRFFGKKFISLMATEADEDFRLARSTGASFRATRSHHSSCSKDRTTSQASSSFYVDSEGEGYNYHSQPLENIMCCEVTCQSLAPLICIGPRCGPRSIHAL